MIRAPFLAIALIAPVASTAQSAPGYYVATPVTAPDKPLLMIRSTPWRMAGATYVAPRAPDRDLIVCQLVAREAGRLQRFAIAGAPFDAATLEKCNARAK